MKAFSRQAPAKSKRVGTYPSFLLSLSTCLLALSIVTLTSKTGLPRWSSLPRLSLTPHEDESGAPRRHVRGLIEMAFTSLSQRAASTGTATSATPQSATSAVPSDQVLLTQLQRLTSGTLQDSKQGPKGPLASSGAPTVSQPQAAAKGAQTVAGSEGPSAAETELRKQMRALQRALRGLRADKARLERERAALAKERDAALKGAKATAAAAVSASTTPTVPTVTSSNTPPGAATGAAVGTSAGVDSGAPAGSKGTSVCATELSALREELRALKARNAEGATASAAASGVVAGLRGKGADAAGAAASTPAGTLAGGAGTPVAAAAVAAAAAAAVAGEGEKQAAAAATSLARSYKLQLTATRDNLANTKEDFRMAVADLKDAKEQLRLRNMELLSAKAALAAANARLSSLGAPSDGAKSGTPATEPQTATQAGASMAGVGEASGEASSVKRVLQEETDASQDAVPVVPSAVKEAETCSMQLEAAKTELATVTYDLKRAREQHSMDEESLQKAKDELSAVLAKAESATNRKTSTSNEKPSASEKETPAKTQDQ